MALLAAGAAATAALFRLCRISNPFFLGPLAFSCVATVLGLPLAPFPDAVVSFAPILLGTWLGSTFRRDRKSVVSGKRGSFRVDLGGRSILKKKKIAQYTAS